MIDRLIGFAKGLLFQFRWLFLSQKRRYAYLWNRTRNQMYPACQESKLPKFSYGSPQLTEKATSMTEVEASVKGIINGFDDREQAAGVALRGGIVSEHGGKIYARSQLGKGATFVVELPVTNGH